MSIRCRPKNKKKKQKTKKKSFDYVTKLQFDNLVFEWRIGK
jgi:hypothetical protein